MESNPILEQTLPNLNGAEGPSQTEFIKNELNFDIDPKDPLTKAALEDHPANEWMDILGNGELEKKVIKHGEKNTRPVRANFCTLKLVAKLEDGTIVEENEKLQIQLGDLEIIQGLDLAIALMDIGEEAEIKVGSRFAYGDAGRPSELDMPSIPPKATIYYTITLESIEMEPDIDTLSVNERRQIGNKKRERGNWWFSRGDSTLAIQCYRRALEFLSPSNENEMGSQHSIKDVEPPSDTDLQNLLEDTLKVHNNLAAAQMKVEAYDAALNHVDQVLRCQPNNVKALYRKGKILHYKGDHTKACSVLMYALKIEPESKVIQQELAILRQKSAKDVLHEKNLYKKMLGTNAKNQKSNNSKHSQIQKLKWGVVGGTVAAIIGIITYKFVS